MQPKVSVLVPIYRTNKEHLRENISSVLNQSFKDFELILLDDCPEHPSIDTVKEFNDPRIKYHVNEKNLGISKSRNKLMELATGEYYAVLDHDDVCQKDRLLKEVEFLDSHKRYGAVGSNYLVIPANVEVKHPEHNSEIKDKMCSLMQMLHPSMMLRASVIKDYHIEYREEYSPCEDYMLCIELAKYTMLHNLQENLMYYRDHPDNTSNNNHELMVDRDAACRDYLMLNMPYRYSISKYYHEKFKEDHLKNFAYREITYKARFLGLTMMSLKIENNHAYVFLFGCLKILSIRL